MQDTPKSLKDRVAGELVTLFFFRMIISLISLISLISPN